MLIIKPVGAAALSRWSERGFGTVLVTGLVCAASATATLTMAGSTNVVDFFGCAGNACCFRRTVGDDACACEGGAGVLVDGGEETGNPLYLPHICKASNRLVQSTMDMDLMLLLGCRVHLAQPTIQRA